MRARSRAAVLLPCCRRGRRAAGPARCATARSVPGRGGAPPSSARAVRPTPATAARSSAGASWRLALEAVADAGLGDDEPRTRRLALDLAPQVGDVHAQILLRMAERLRPHCVEQLLVRQR